MSECKGKKPYRTYSVCHNSGKGLNIHGKKSNKNISIRFYFQVMNKHIVVSDHLKNIRLFNLPDNDHLRLVQVVSRVGVFHRPSF